MSRTLYPHSEPRTAVWLPVGDEHEIYVEEGGNPAGLPLVFLHGGPGSGCKPSHRQFFDPARYRSILLDQRGAGRSRPYGGIEHNSTPHLIADLELVRQHFAIDRWVLFGGSWGAALALAYAETYPARVLGMVLRGTFLARARDVDWFFADGASRLLPAAWSAFQDEVGVHSDLVDVLYRAVTGSNAALAEKIARAWARWSGEVVMYSLDAAGSDLEPPLAESLAKTRIEMHYARHHYFLRENQLLHEAERLAGIPLTIIHGRRDITCTADAAWALHRRLPHSRLEILPTAGHLSSEVPMTEALVAAADEMAELLGRKPTDPGRA